MRRFIDGLFVLFVEIIFLAGVASVFLVVSSAERQHYDGRPESIAAESSR